MDDSCFIDKYKIFQEQNQLQSSRITFFIKIPGMSKRTKKPGDTKWKLLGQALRRSFPRFHSVKINISSARNKKVIFTAFFLLSSFSLWRNKQLKEIEDNLRKRYRRPKKWYQHYFLRLGRCQADSSLKYTDK